MLSSPLLNRQLTPNDKTITEQVRTGIKTFRRQTFRPQTFRRPVIPPTDISPTDISSTDISPTGHSADRHFAYRNFADGYFADSIDISPTGHFADRQIADKYYFDRDYTAFTLLLGLHHKMHFAMHIILCINIYIIGSKHTFLCWQFYFNPHPGQILDSIRDLGLDVLT